MIKYCVSDFLKEINSRIKFINSHSFKRKFNCELLTCKSLASLIGVTPATISNLNSNSKFDLIDSVVLVIRSNYDDFLFDCRKRSLQSFIDDSEKDFYSGYPELFDYSWILRQITSVYSVEG
ncbi:MAG: hypothetical protein MJ232_03120 [archaeon]|nr:hypothetical protein [archaeon]